MSFVEGATWGSTAADKAVRERYAVTDKEFLELFSRQKDAFMKDFEKTGQPIKSNARTGPAGDHKNMLEWFERWLRGENITTSKKEPKPVQVAKSFDEFIDEVLAEAKEILAERNIPIVYSLPGQSLGISESWKCVKVFGNRDIYYRIGKTRPRKGPRKGQELLVLDLVMDGHKKQVFVPLLSRKDEIEKKLDDVLERELPKVESTGKYRLKVMLPIELVQQGDTGMAARKFADFITVTKPLLNKLGVL